MVIVSMTETIEEEYQNHCCTFLTSSLKYIFHAEWENRTMLEMENHGCTFLFSLKVCTKLHTIYPFNIKVKSIY